MEHNTKFDLVMLPDPAAIIVVSACKNKNALRQTCKRFCAFASRRKNENILTQPQLYLNQEALDRYLLYYGALGNTAIVRNLLARGANQNACEDNGLKLLHYAMQFGYEDIVNILLEHPNAHGLKIKSDFLPKKQGNQSAISERIFSAYALNNTDAEALWYAVENGLYTMVQNLLACNVDPNVMNAKKSLLEIATQNGHINIMKLLMINGMKVDISLAIEKGYTSAVQLLIDYGVNVDIALYSACIYGCKKIVKISLENGANVNNKGTNDNTPLHKACEYRNTETVKILLENGADVNAKNQDGEMPLHIACRKGDKGIVKMLLEKGAKPNARRGYNGLSFESGARPLHLACERGHGEVVKILLENGADVGGYNSHQQKPFYCTTKKNIKDILIEYEKKQYPEPECIMQ